MDGLFRGKNTYRTEFFHGIRLPSCLISPIISLQAKQDAINSKYHLHEMSLNSQIVYMERSIMILSDSTCKVWTPRILGILRIIIGFLFLQHGTAKLFGTPHIAMFDGLQLVSLLGLAGLLELAGGLLILVGLFTRQTAFI